MCLTTKWSGTWTTLMEPPSASLQFQTGKSNVATAKEDADLESLRATAKRNFQRCPFAARCPCLRFIILVTAFARIVSLHSMVTDLTMAVVTNATVTITDSSGVAAAWPDLRRLRPYRNPLETLHLVPSELPRVAAVAGYPATCARSA